MTDRAQGLLVHLDADYRIGDEDTGADPIMEAIGMIKGVAKVEPMVSDYGSAMAYERARRELVSQLWEVLASKNR